MNLFKGRYNKDILEQEKADSIVENEQSLTLLPTKHLQYVKVINIYIQI